MAQQQIGRYILQGQAGRGGMSLVYRAFDPEVRREVAIKILPRMLSDDETTRARFTREARVIAGLEHPAIVPIYDFGTYQDQLYLVMRFMTGGSLAERIQRGPLPLPEAVRIIRRLASALDEAHAQGIIHRDLKTANILFDHRGEAFLSDFGIAKLLEATTALTTNVIGTPAYMSPEQAQDRPLDSRSDVYSLGVILFEMLTGRLPFNANTAVGLLYQHVHQPVPDMAALRRDTPPTVQAVLARALAKDPAERYATAGEMATALESAAAVRSRLAGWRLSLPLAAAGGLAGLCVLLVTAGAFLAATGRLNLGGTAVPTATRLAAVPPTPDPETPAPAASPEPTDTLAPTATSSPEPSPVTATAEPSLTPAPSPTPSLTPSPTQTASPTSTRTPTPRPTESGNPTGPAQTGAGLPLTFETFGVWVRGDQPNGTFTRSTEQATSGAASGRLDYNFSSAGNDFVVFLQLNAVAGEPDALQLNVLGDGAGHFLNVWVRDNDGQTWQVPMGRITHTGWQQLTGRIAVDQPWPWTHISGPDNGQVDYPLTFRGFVLDDVNDAYEGSGVIFLDDLTATNLGN